jgi:hypothetical protein
VAPRAGAKRGLTALFGLAAAVLQMLMATTGNGQLVPLLISGSAQEGGIAAAPLPTTSSEQPINWPCWFSSTSPSSGVANTGGTGE